MKKLLVALLSTAFVTSAFAAEASAPAEANNAMMAKADASSAKHSKKHSNKKHHKSHKAASAA